MNTVSHQKTVRRCSGISTTSQFPVQFHVVSVTMLQIAVTICKFEYLFSLLADL